MSRGSPLERALTLWRIPPRVVVIVLAALVVLVGFVWFAFARTGERMVDSLRWYGQVEIAGRSTGWSGDVHLRGVRLSTYGPEPQLIFSADRMVLDTPGFLWTLLAGYSGAGNAAIESYLSPTQIEAVRAGGDLPAALPPMRAFAVDVEGVVAGPALQSFGELRWFGLASASPFDSAACELDRGFESSDLMRMGLPDEPVRARLAVSLVDATTADVEVALSRDGASRATLGMRLRADDPERIIDADPATLIALERRWDVADEGFIAARNRYCAGRLGISRDGYVDRHIDAVRARLAALGVRADPAVEGAYRRFVGRGGELTWRAQPSLATTFGQMARFSPAQQLRLLNATIESVRGRAVPFALDFNVPLAAPPIEAADDPAAALAAPDGAVADAMPAPVTPPAAGADPSAADAGAAEPVSPAAVPAGAVPPAAPAAVVDVPEVPADVAAAGAAQPAPAAAGPTNGSSSVTEPAAALPAGMQPLPRRTAYAPGQIVPYEALANMQGRRFEITSIYGTRRRGTLEKYTNAALTLRLGPREGSLRLTMPQRTVREIRLLDHFSGEDSARAAGG
jgi:hypothetical protein